ncbi:MAG: hypothetical protein D6679_13645, partial [Candidatus Hydrogenedentota bacterium]
QLASGFVVDDTPEGHSRLVRFLMGLRKRFPRAIIRIGMEHTGGLKRNWYALLRKKQEKLGLQVRCINPFVIKQFCRLQLHQSKTDRTSART